MNQTSESQIQSDYTMAKGHYADLGVDTEAALARLENIPISLQCWQGDDTWAASRTPAAS